MPTRFEQREARVSASIDREHGELTRIVPRSSANGPYIAGGVDSARTIREVIGIVDVNPVIARIRDKSEYDEFRPELEGEVIHVSYATSRFAARADWPRKKDEIHAFERVSLPNKFQVVDVQPDGIGRFLCRCVVLK